MTALKRIDVVQPTIRPASTPRLRREPDCGDAKIELMDVAEEPVELVELVEFVVSGVI